MNEDHLKEKIQEIVKQATVLKDRHTDEKDACVNYACIFSQSKEEYEELIETSHKIGKIVKKTTTGLLFQIQPLNTVSGILKLLKIRLPDKTRPELGDTDFTVSNYDEFKEKHLSKKGFKLIQKEGFEMLELMNPKFNVRVYFSHPTLGEVLGVEGF
ncbi:MAG: hypothetical protein KKB03_03450 [Nanoarchaeota archaeon]|nr:hypothetical protein [Nanoarchaeota archaeon]MBU1135572.1 hypothetical protein [Nanoarchaeota archaeon]MBU2520269.1 hypothetical protein [Nanoarchaeota archaeon]